MRISDWSSDVCSSDLGSIDVACRLHRFDHRGVAALAEFGAGVGNLDEDDVAELPLREVGDADRRDVAIDVDPFMFFGVVTRHRSGRSEEHTSELRSLMRISYAVLCLQKKKNTK